MAPNPQKTVDKFSLIAHNRISNSIASEFRGLPSSWVIELRKTGEVIGEFTARPSGPVEAHPYTVNRDRNDRLTKNIKIARDSQHARNGDYILTVMDNGNALYVGYKLRDNELSSSIRKKLTVLARTNDLLGKDGKTRYNKDDEVYILVDGANKLNAAHNRNRKQ